MTDANETQGVAFGGVIGPTWWESTPWWPPEPSAPSGAPNVLLIVLDDVGYAQLGCYGSDIETPNLDRLAAQGMRLANFHTTALCSPTRACLLTGRNHHSCGMARVADLAIGFPGYWGRIPRSVGFLPEILGEHGYASFAVGKWHLTPEDETHMAASRASWPVGRGFQRWYGFHGGETHQFVPSLFQDNHAVAPPRTPDDGYHLSEDLADRAIEYLGDHRNVDDTKPWFLYFATGACHSPHHAPQRWLDHYAGRFDDGWDAWRERTHARQIEMGLIPEGTRLAPRPAWVPAWETLGEADQRVAARFMECFAGFLSHADEQIGRVLDFVERMGETDNTLVVAISDNGASAEGGEKGSINDARLWNGLAAGRRELRERVDEIGTADSHNNYPWGWTMAGNTPFKRWKREVHEGGVTDPCIVRLPGRVAEPGSIRHQFHHVVDIVPTILDVIGVAMPAAIGGVAQRPLEGTSFASLFATPDAPETHTTQYFEMLGSRAIYHDGWKAVTYKPLAHMYDDGIDPDAPFDDDRWELYDKRRDFSETDDLAEREPDRLRAMQALWWSEAERYQVLPLDNRPLAALMDPHMAARERARYVFWPNGAPVPEPITVNVRNRSHRIRAHVALDGTPVSGVLLAMGNVLGGWSLHAIDGRLRYVHNVVGWQRHEVSSDVVVPSTARTLGYTFERTADFAGIGRLLVDDEVVAEAPIPFTTPVRFSISGGGLTCGYEAGPPVGIGYDAPFAFTGGRIDRVEVEVDGVAVQDLEAAYAQIMSEQ